MQWEEIKLTKTFHFLKIDFKILFPRSSLQLQGTKLKFEFSFNFYIHKDFKWGEFLEGFLIFKYLHKRIKKTQLTCDFVKTRFMKNAGE